MFSPIQNIQILGKFYTIEQTVKLCDEITSNPKVEVWEKEIYKFIQDWLSSSVEITVTTSGSTGTPKEINIRKKHMIASANATLSFFKLKQGDSAWLCIPVKYIAGKMMIVRSIVGNLNLVYSMPNSVPIIKNNQNITFAAMVPNQVFELINTQAGLKQLHNISTLLIGGSSISSELENHLLKIPSLVIWHSYGMTETITHIALRKLSPVSKNSYYPLSGVKISVNLNNQLIIDAPAIGVTNLVTNDIAKLMDGGSFDIIGRADNVIVSGGIKLHPEIIENKIKQKISYNFFIGSVADKKLGEKLILFIEGSLTKDFDTVQVKKNISNILSKFEIPKEIVFLKSFLRTENGKLRRNTMINRYIKDYLSIQS